MDSISQAALGAIVGYIIAGKKYKKKSLLWGAVVATLPDLDFIPMIPFNDELMYIKHHRGITHSLLFCIVAPLLLSPLLKKKFSIPKLTTFWFGFWVLLTHAFLDVLNVWGTAIFWPLNHRIALNTLFIIDPLYTVPLLTSILFILLSKKTIYREKTALIGLILSTCYVIWGLGVKMSMNKHFEDVFFSSKPQILRYTTIPTPFNTLLWASVAETKDNFYFTTLSIFNKKNTEPSLYEIKKNHSILPSNLHPKISDLIRITKGYFSIEKTSNGLLLHDLRYGLLGFPEKNGEMPVFSYLIQELDTHEVIITPIRPQTKNISMTSILTEIGNKLKEDLKGKG
jgi:inner membrane protein